MRRLILLALLFTGCLPIYNRKIWEPGKKVTSFPGIEQSISGDLRILIVHGMGDQEPGFADGTIDRIARKLSLVKKSEKRTIPITKGEPPIDYGHVEIREFVKDGNAVTFYALLWSPLTRPLEEKYVGYDWSVPTHRRALLDKSIKKKLIDQSFTDAFLFAGKFRGEMEYSMRAGLCAALTGAEKLAEECQWSTRSGMQSLYIITHSLGSVLLIETLRNMKRASGDQPNAADDIINRTQAVALLANQFPLFQLTVVEHPEPEGRMAPLSPERTLAPLFAGRETVPLPFIAFSDPNDLLSFTIPDDWGTKLFPDLYTPKRLARFINATPNNTWPIAGLIAIPTSAHTAYWDEPWVIRRLAHGHNVK